MLAASGWRRVAGVGGVAVLALVAPSLAEACKFAFTPHQLDEGEKAVDTTPPGTPVVGPVRISRGHGPSPSAGGTTSSSCDDIGAITFTLSATDDRTPAPTMGFRLTARGPGSLEGFQPVGMDVRLSDGKMSVRWLDGATDDQESLDLEFEVRAIDLAGNVSAQPAIVTVHQDMGGCSLGRGATSADRVGVVAFGIVALMIASRRRPR